MASIRFVDTTIRDGQQSLWANNMRTAMVLPIATNLDRAGFDAIELALVHPKKIVREMKEDPWERIREVRKRVTETPLRQTAGRFRLFEVTPRSMYELFMERMHANGIRQARVSEEWNQLAMWQWKVNVARQVGTEPIINLIFSESPRHTDEYYAERTRQAVSLDPFRLCLKDPGGLLTPERMRTLVPAILANGEGKELELHSHCTTGLGPLNALEAVKLGLTIINVAIPPLANGASLPNVFSLAHNLRFAGHQPLIDEQPLKPVAEHLTACAKKSRLPVGAPLEYELSQYAHQIPGGMLSNLRHQLQLVGLERKLPETLEECALVRKEFGYPVMVTPLSQFVGSQAAINVIVGDRYKQVSDQTIHYALGRWGGQEAIDAMDPDIRDRILSRPRAKQLERWDPPEPTLKELRQQYGGPGVGDDEMLLRMEVSVEDIAAMRAAGPTRDSLSIDGPLVTLIRELARRPDRNFIKLQKNGTTITLGRGIAQWTRSGS